MMFQYTYICWAQSVGNHNSILGWWPAAA